MTTNGGSARLSKTGNGSLRAVALVARRPERDTARAMSQENVEVIREAFGRWNAGDIDFWIEHAEPDVEIRSKYAALDQGGAYRGHEGMREWMEEIDRNFEFFEVEADRVHDLGDKVLVLGGVHFRGRASETEIEYPFGWVCEMRDGRLSRMTFHSSHAEALEAAGLEE